MPSDLSGLKALTFDVFGTVVDWRCSVVSELESAAAAKTSSDALSPSDKEKLASVDWPAFAQEWRNTYKVFTQSYAAGKSEWKDVDAHHHDSLAALLSARGITGYAPEEIRHLSLAWHRLRPWDDSAAGLRRLGGKFTTATLSNGNRSLLQDLDAFGGLGFSKILSAEDWRAYKPAPAVYDGAVTALLGEGAAAGDVGMVAAHLGDLAAARVRGMRTVYVERPGEEDWEVGGERYEEARGWVDLWVQEGEGGFEEVAKRLGV
ncbi:haloacid type ii [Colletotrichum musicola]|uniref:Haloacid type ii n=1 Tax=Colletotrichum musicola TaxID=2175873 RepID=A0A8H6U6K7_9PEZI|nr:haloacid type ii [Colletotrichum musicola]